MQEPESTKTSQSLCHQEGGLLAIQLGALTDGRSGRRAGSSSVPARHSPSFELCFLLCSKWEVTPSTASCEA